MAEVNNTTDSSSTTTTEAPAPVTDVQPPASSSTTETVTPPVEEPTILTPAPTEEPPAETPPAEEEPKPAENAELFGAPEGEYEITGLPEGTVIDKAALAQFEPVAKELGLSNAGMSKVAAAYADMLPKLAEGFEADLQSRITAQQAEWASAAIEAVKTDPAFGGKPMSEVQQIAAKALDRFGGQEIREYLQQTGLGNNPAMVKFAFLAGSAISEDTTFERGGTIPTAKSRTEKYYGPQS